MTLKTFFSNVGKFLATKTKEIFSLVTTAKVENIFKACLFVGASAYTGYVLITDFVEKRRSYKDRANMTTVDRALALNYADKSNREALSPIFDEINMAFDKGPKGKKKFRKFTKEDREELERINQKIATLVPTFDNQGDYYYSELLDDLEIFKEDMKEVQRMDRLRDATEDEYTLWRIWHSPAY